MKTLLLAATAAAAFAFPAASFAQHSDHSAHPPAPAPAPPAPPPSPAPAADPHADHEVGNDGRDPQDPGPASVRIRTPRPSVEAADPHAGHGGGEPSEGHANHEPCFYSPGGCMRGALGPYPMQREAAGTSWQPDASEHGGIHIQSGQWSLMGHALLNGVYDWQQGPRGDEMGFLSGMVMGSARRPLGSNGTLQLRAMLSPDPIMGARGYPLLLAAGETADGEHVLVDRQHPHDLFMELSASVSVRLGGRASLFVYGGLPGAPAFGPPAFMHRLSAMDSPEAPISHHWLDSTHIAFGVVTGGLVIGDLMIEASRFNGREPDEDRWDIETGPLDSTAARISLNPTRNLSLQASWAHLVEPELLEPGENETRLSASAIYTRRLGERGWWSTTLAWGRRSSDHDDLDAFTLESAVGRGSWTLFGRAERIETNELSGDGHGHHGPVFDVSKVSAGLVRDFRLGDHVRLGVGGLYALNFVPSGLEASYGGDPDGAMVFLRLRVD
jgi:hypothetical protein